MRKWFVIIVLAFFWISIRAPFEKTDVAKLSPVSALVFSRKDGCLRISSDLGDLGIGGSLEEALVDMELTCPSVIFLDTVEYLLIGPGSVETEELAEYFRSGAYVLRCGPNTDPAKAVEYLKSRNGNVTLRDVEMNEKQMPVLEDIDGRYYLNEQRRESDTLNWMDGCGDPGTVGDRGAGKRMGCESDNWNTGGGDIARDK